MTTQVDSVRVTVGGTGVPTWIPDPADAGTFISNIPVADMIPDPADPGTFIPA